MIVCSRISLISMTSFSALLSPLFPCVSTFCLRSTKVHTLSSQERLVLKCLRRGAEKSEDFRETLNEANLIGALLSWFNPKVRELSSLSPHTMSLSRSTTRLLRSTSSCPACLAALPLPLPRHHFSPNLPSPIPSTSRSFTSYTLPRRAPILDQTPNVPPPVAVNPTTSSPNTKPKRTIRARKAAVSLVSPTHILHYPL